MDQLSYSFKLTDILNDAAGHPAIWEKFLSQLTKQLNCESSLLLINNVTNRKESHTLSYFNLKNHQLKYDKEYESQLDIFNFFIGKHPRQVFYNQDVLCEAENTFSDNKRLHDCRLKYRLGFSIPCHHHVLSLHISRRQSFSHQELQRYKIILQEIIYPLEDAIHLEQQKKTYSQLIHQSEQPFDGYLIIDKYLNIVSIDPIYRAIFPNIDDLEILDSRLSITDKSLKQLLLKQISSPNKQIETSYINSLCQINFFPVKRLENLYNWECFKDDFILTFSLSKLQNKAFSRLLNVHQLSKSEAICALHFVQTSSIAEIALKTNRSEETVRNHIKRIMHKMNVHNQAALMKKLMILSAL